MRRTGKFDAVCHTCGGYGKDGGCPKCGLTPRSSVTVKSISLDLPLDVIPEVYKGKLWEHETEPNAPLTFVDFDKKLERVHSEFLNARVPKFSMFISAPPKYGKRAFAFACMQTALVQSFSVAPLFTTSDWRRLYRVSQMNPFYKLYDKYKWDDLVARDVVFLSVDYSDDRFDVVGLLKDILDTRSTFSKPTFILSDYKLEELVPRWGDASYNAIYNPDEKRDYIRYPVIIQRFN